MNMHSSFSIGIMTRNIPWNAGWRWFGWLLKGNSSLDVWVSSKDSDCAVLALFWCKTWYVYECNWAVSCVSQDIEDWPALTILTVVSGWFWFDQVRMSGTIWGSMVCLDQIFWYEFTLLECLVNEDSIIRWGADIASTGMEINWVINHCIVTGKLRKDNRLLFRYKHEQADRKFRMEVHWDCIDRPPGGSKDGDRRGTPKKTSCGCSCEIQSGADLDVVFISWIAYIPRILFRHVSVRQLPSPTFITGLCLFNLLTKNGFECISISSKFADTFSQFLDSHLLFVEVKSEKRFIVDVCLLLQVQFRCTVSV